MFSFEYHIPTRIVFGKGSVKRAGEIASEFGKRVMLVSYDEELLKQLDQLPLESQKKLLEFARALNATTLKGKPGKDLLKFAGSIDRDSLKAMEEAVEYGCERVDDYSLFRFSVLPSK